MPPSENTSPALRNVALVAHVDHGKTTLVDALLRCHGRLRRPRRPSSTGSWTPTTRSASGASPSSPRPPRSSGSGVRINLVDTPGHADFGGEVERALAMVDGVLLLVDAAEGPLPQTRYVLSKALGAEPAGGRRAQQGRPPGRPARRGPRRDLPALPRPRRRRPAHRVPDRLGRSPATARPSPASACPATDADLAPLLDAILDTIPRARGRPRRPAAGPRHQPRRLRLPRAPRHRPGRAAAPCAGASRSPCCEERRGPGPAQAHASPSCMASRASAASRSTSSSPATCSSSPASPRSRSATPSPTRPTPCRCPASRSTSRCCA